MAGKDRKWIRGIAIIMLLIGSVLPASGADISRTLSTTAPLPGEEVDVVLLIKGIEIGGIVETIPEGFVFLGTAHPQDQVNVSGNRIIFSVINESRIEYKVRAPAQGSGTFSGVWIDALNKTEGVIGDTVVSVRGSAPTQEATPAKTTAPTPSKTSTPETGGFMISSTILAFLAVYILVRVREV